MEKLLPFEVSGYDRKEVALLVFAGSVDEAKAVGFGELSMWGEADEKEDVNAVLLEGDWPYKAVPDWEKDKLLKTDGFIAKTDALTCKVCGFWCELNQDNVCEPCFDRETEGKKGKWK